MVDSTTTYLEFPFSSLDIECLNPEESEDLLIKIKDLTKGLGVDASLDASSSPAARSIAVKCVKTWGKACFVGEGGDVTLDVSNDLLRRQVTLIGSWTFSKHLAMHHRVVQIMFIRYHLLQIVSKRYQIVQITII